MKKPALLVALSLSILACDSDSTGAEQSELGDVALNDSTDATGKADALMGRTVRPFYTELVDYGAETKSGVATVTDVGDLMMTVESPLVVFEPVEDSLQITVSGREETDMRYFLVYQTAGEEGWHILQVEGEGTFEDGQGDADPTPVLTTYFQSVSILASENTISLASDDAGGQTTTRLEFDVAGARFGVLVLPIDSGWGNALLGEFPYTLEAKCDGHECGEEAPVDPEVPVDDYAQARDPDLLKVTIGGAAIDYAYPSVDTGFGLGGTEFWQKWAGGHNPTYSYGAGTEAGRKCMLASAIRFETIMSDPPEAMVRLKDETNWGGRFFNWNDDYSESSDDARYAVLWAWRTGLVKWISQTAQDGTCFLPTREIVQRAAENCLSRGAANDGEIEGCQG